MLFPTLAVVGAMIPCALQDAPKPAAPAAVEVSVPSSANATCPVMGKPASESLFVDTELGRIYVCCPPCYKKINANVGPSYLAAYPTVKPAGNTVCPITGDPLPAAPVLHVIQGVEVGLCCATCVEDAAKRPQVTLAVVNDPKLREVRNDICPVSGEPADDNLICRIGDELIHLSSMKHLAQVKDDPATMLKKAKALATRPKAPAKPEPARGAPDPGEADHDG